MGPGFGYNVNPTKSWLVTKSSCYDVAVSQFSDSGVNVTFFRFSITVQSLSIIDILTPGLGAGLVYPWQ